MCEPLLLSLLLYARPRIRLAAIEALGRVGTPAAIEPFLNLASDPIVADQVNSALRRLDERWHRGGAGHLSVAADSDQTGAVSLAERSGDLEIAKHRL